MDYIHPGDKRIRDFALEISGGKAQILLLISV